jgi:alpha-L-fucosidase 2
MGNPDSNNLRLWYEKPAKEWEEALPIGNGRLGGMVFGGAEVEQIQLNEDTLWAGMPRDTNNDDALKHLEKVRELTKTGKFAEAEQLIESNMLGPNTQPYQPLGNLYLKHEGFIDMKSYSRELNLDTAIATTSYMQGDTKFTREIFVSAVDQVMVARVKCDQPGELNITASIDCFHLHHVFQKDMKLALVGQCPSHVGKPPNLVVYEANQGIKFESQLKAITTGGTVHINERNELEVRNA